MAPQFGITSTAEEVAQTFAEQIRGKNVLITGASPEGLGAEAARVVAKYASLVIIAGRSQAKLEKTVADIKAETPSAKLRILILDLASLASVRKAAAEVNAYAEPIHVLINNAAVMACPYSLTEDGFENQLGSNHLGPFLFTALIFPRVVAGGSSTSPARIVNVSSVAHRWGEFRFDDYGFSEGKTYEDMASYAQSKTANILFANEIARRAKESAVPVLAYSLHPGGILTPLQRHLKHEDMVAKGWKNEAGEWLFPMKTVPEGTATHIVAAFDPALEDKSGAYLEDAHVSEENRAPYAASEEGGRKLWELSEKLTSHTFAI